MLRAAHVSRCAGLAGRRAQGSGEHFDPPAPAAVLAVSSYSRPLCSDSSTRAYVTKPSGLQYFDLAVGAGEQPCSGDIVQVHYTGRLTNGLKFDSSYDRGRPISFTIGTSKIRSRNYKCPPLLRGWDEGILSMRVRCLECNAVWLLGH